MTQRRALGDPDVESGFDDPDDGWFGHVQTGAPTVSRHHDDTPDTTHDVDATDVADTDRFPVLMVDPTPAVQMAAGPIDSPPGASGPRHSRFDDAPPSWESRLSSSGAWDFKSSAVSAPRDRVKFAVVGGIVAVLAVVGVVLLLRTPSPTADESTTVAPSESTGRPVPSATAPAVSTPGIPVLPPGPLAPPPPPPPTAEEISPPVVTRDYTPRRQTSPEESDEPKVDVTRTPAPRSPGGATPSEPRRNPWTIGEGWN